MQKPKSYLEIIGSQSDVIDFTIRQKASVYTVKESIKDGVNCLVKDKKLFEFDYIPLLDLESREQLLEKYFGYKIITEILERIDSLYYFVYRIAFEEFVERKKSANNTTYFIQNEIKCFETLSFNDNVYSTFRGMTVASKENINIFKNIRGLMERVLKNNIKDFNLLIYGESDATLIFEKGMKTVKESEKLFNSIINIAYSNILSFLKQQVVKEEKKNSKRGEDIKDDVYLKWLGTLPNLRNISKELHLKKYTEKPTSFVKLFTEKSNITWLKEPEYLAYLLYKLYHHDVRQFSPSDNSKAYLKTANKYCNYSTKIAKKYNLSTVIHNVIIRQASKYVQLRKRVESFVTGQIK